MYKHDLALNNLQRLLYHKTQPTNQPTNQKNATCNLIIIIIIIVYHYAASA